MSARICIAIVNEARAALIIDQGRSEKIAVLNSYIFLPWTTKTRVITSSAPIARRMLHGPPFGGISYRGRVLKENVKWRLRAVQILTVATSAQIILHPRIQNIPVLKMVSYSSLVFLNTSYLPPRCCANIEKYSPYFLVKFV